MRDTAIKGYGLIFAALIIVALLSHYAYAQSEDNGPARKKYSVSLSASITFEDKTPYNLSTGHTDPNTGSYTITTSPYTYINTYTITYEKEYSIIELEYRGPYAQVPWMSTNDITENTTVKVTITGRASGYQYQENYIDYVNPNELYTDSVTKQCPDVSTTLEVDPGILFVETMMLAPPEVSITNDTFLTIMFFAPMATQTLLEKTDEINKEASMERDRIRREIEADKNIYLSGRASCPIAPSFVSNALLTSGYKLQLILTALREATMKSMGLTPASLGMYYQSSVPGVPGVTIFDTAFNTADGGVRRYAFTKEELAKLDPYNLGGLERTSSVSASVQVGVTCLENCGFIGPGHCPAAQVCGSMGACCDSNQICQGGVCTSSTGPAIENKPPETPPTPVVTDGILVPPVSRPFLTSVAERKAPTLLIDLLGWYEWKAVNVSSCIRGARCTTSAECCNADCVGGYCLCGMAACSASGECCSGYCEEGRCRTAPSMSLFTFSKPLQGCAGFIEECLPGEGSCFLICDALTALLFIVSVTAGFVAWRRLDITGAVAAVCVSLLIGLVTYAFAGIIAGLLIIAMLALVRREAKITASVLEKE